MVVINLKTQINAPIELVFDNSRDLDLHQQSAKHTNEKAIAGRTSGLIELGETVTWRARHFGIYQKLTVKITEFQRPDFFVDEMVKGAFKSMRHIHRFEKIESGTMMYDEFQFSAPLGILGRIVEKLVLKRYMTRFLEIRNAELKRVSEKQVHKAS